MKKSLVFLLIAVLLVSLLISGCGGKGGSGVVSHDDAAKIMEKHGLTVEKEAEGVSGSNDSHFVVYAVDKEASKAFEETVAAFGTDELEKVIDKDGHKYYKGEDSGLGMILAQKGDAFLMAMSMKDFAGLEKIVDEFNMK